MFLSPHNPPIWWNCPIAASLSANGRSRAGGWALSCDSSSRHRIPRTIASLLRSASHRRRVRTAGVPKLAFRGTRRVPCGAGRHSTLDPHLDDSSLRRRSFGRCVLTSIRRRNMLSPKWLSCASGLSATSCRTLEAGPVRGRHSYTCIECQRCGGSAKMVAPRPASCQRGLVSCCDSHAV